MPDAVPLRHKRNTARGLVVRDGQLLLMERWRSGMHYFSIPGGGIEADETPEATVAREIHEETSVNVKVIKKVLAMRDGEFLHQIYLCQYIEGEARLSAQAPEALHMTEGNHFKPGWVPIEHLSELPFTYWQPLKQPLLDGLADGFTGPIKIVTAGL